MSNPAKLMPKDLENYYEFRRIEGKIIERIDYVLRKIYDAFGCKIKCWWFNGAAEGETGSLSMGLNANSISNWEVELEEELHVDMIIMLDSAEYEFWEFPKSWLFEDFEKKLINGRKEYLELEEKRNKILKNKRKARKIKKDKAIEAVKKKLSPEEIKLLNL